MVIFFVTRETLKTKFGTPFKPYAPYGASKHSMTTKKCYVLEYDTPLRNLDSRWSNNDDGGRFQSNVGVRAQRMLIQKKNIDYEYGDSDSERHAWWHAYVQVWLFAFRHFPYLSATSTLTPIGPRWQNGHSMPASNGSVRIMRTQIWLDCFELCRTSLWHKSYIPNKAMLMSCWPTNLSQHKILSHFLHLWVVVDRMKA